MSHLITLLLPIVYGLIVGLYMRHKGVFPFGVQLVLLVVVSMFVSQIETAIVLYYDAPPWDEPISSTIRSVTTLIIVVTLFIVVGGIIAQAIYEAFAKTRTGEAEPTSS